MRQFKIRFNTFRNILFIYLLFTNIFAQYDCNDQEALNYNSNSNSVEDCLYDPFVWIQSTAQSFYVVDELFSIPCTDINDDGTCGEPIPVETTLGDTSSYFVIGVKCGENEIVTGSSQWIDGGTTVVANGRHDQTEGTEEYCFGGIETPVFIPGDIPVFEVFDASRDIYYEATFTECYDLNNQISDCIWADFGYRSIPSLTFKVQNVEGCTDYEACNFDPNTFVNDGSCSYAEDIGEGVCNCDGEFFDCEGTCGGTVLNDCEGVCGGDAELLDYYIDADGDSLGTGDPTEFCDALVEDGWVTNADDIDDNCYSNDLDCADVCDGSALIFEYYIDEDSDSLGAGQPTEFCDALVEDGWVTNADDIDDNCFSNIHDCADVCDGSAEIFEYYLDTDGDDLGAGQPTEYCDALVDPGWVLNGEDEDDNCFSNIHDCADVCDGSEIEDCNGVCSTEEGFIGNTGELNEIGEDCNGVCGGEAYTDLCGLCVGGDTELEACTCQDWEIDCAGNCPGLTYLANSDALQYNSVGDLLISVIETDEFGNSFISETLLAQLYGEFWLDSLVWLDSLEVYNYTLGFDCNNQCGGVNVFDCENQCRPEGLYSLDSESVCCETEFIDCSNTCYGENEEDDGEGCCLAGDIGCDGFCGSGLVFDACENCGGQNYINENGEIVGPDVDCAGVCYGTAQTLEYYYDEDGDSLGFGDATEFCDALVEDGWVLIAGDDDDNCFSNVHDCDGVCDGNAYLDCNGVCSTSEDFVGDIGEFDETGLDCNGDCEGLATIDDCGLCTGGNTEYNACTCPDWQRDCNNNCPGFNYLGNDTTLHFNSLGELLSSYIVLDTTITIVDSLSNVIDIIENSATINEEILLEAFGEFWMDSLDLKLGYDCNNECGGLNYLDCLGTCSSDEEFIGNTDFLDEYGNNYLGECNGDALPDYVFSFEDTINTPPNMQLNIPINLQGLSDIPIYEIYIEINYPSEVFSPNSVIGLESFSAESDNYNIDWNINENEELIVIDVASNNGNGISILDEDILVISGFSGNGDVENGIISLYANPSDASGNPLNCMFYDGNIQISDFYLNLMGTVNYYSNGQNTPNVDIILDGHTSLNEYYADTTASDEFGEFSFYGILPGSYSVIPTKNNLLYLNLGGELSSTDASQIARHSVGLYDFTIQQQLAADVTLNGSVSGLDASKVARYRVGDVDALNEPDIHWIFYPEIMNIEELMTNAIEDGNSLISADCVPNYNNQSLPNYCSDGPLVNQPCGTEEDIGEVIINSPDCPLFLSIRLGDVTGNWNPIPNLSMENSILEDPIEIDISENSFSLPIRILDSGNMEGVDIEIEYDSELFQLNNISYIDATLSQMGYNLMYNEIDGLIIISSYATNTLSNIEEFLNFEFSIINDNLESGEIQITEFKFNENVSESGFEVIDEFNQNIITQHIIVNTTNLSVESNLPKSYRLYQNMPNPFNPVTEISFDIPKSSNVSIEIYNIKGDRVLKLVENQMYSAGHHQIKWDASQNSGGIYFYRLTAENFQKTNKMILIK